MAGRKLIQPEPPKSNEPRQLISYRARSEIYDFQIRSGASVKELANFIGINENTFRDIQRGSRDRLPTAEVLHQLDTLNSAKEFERVPKRDGRHIDVFFIITGRKFSLVNDYTETLRKKINELESKVEDLEKDNDGLSRTIKRLARQE